MNVRTILLMVAGCLVATSLHSALTCPTAATLEDLALCIRGQMPASGSNGFVPATLEEQADWRRTVRAMLSRQCNFPLAATLRNGAELRTFSDAENGKSYCVLMETADTDNNGRVDRGWGTFIVDTSAVREISHQAPHPIADSTTDTQAIAIFKATASRSYLMAGAHRSATPGASTCQPEYGPADAAHNVDNMFHATNAELLAWYGAQSWTAIQWHGMAAATCSVVDVYLSHGRNVVPRTSDKIVHLRTNLLRQHPGWRVETPGTGACSLNATENTQGRLLNGVEPAAVCSEPARSDSGTFVHIEQDPAFRNPADWSQAIIETWPAAPRRRRTIR